MALRYGSIKEDASALKYRSRDYFKANVYTILGYMDPWVYRRALIWFKGRPQQKKKTGWWSLGVPE